MKRSSSIHFFPTAKFLTNFRLIKSFFILPILILSFAGNSAAAESVDANEDLVKPSMGQVFEDKSKLTRTPTKESDQETLRVLTSLVQQAGWFPKIKLSVIDGMVVIEGVADEKSQLDWLAKTADRMPAVVAVVNKAELATTAVTDLSPALNEVRRLLDMAKRAMPNLLLALALLAVFYFMNRFLSKGMVSIWQKHINNPFLLATVAKLSLLPIWLLFFYLILRTAGLSGLATTIIGGTGMLGLVLGLAFRGIAENYLAGLLLAMRSPFTKGDLIEIDKFTGYVQNLSMRGTTIIDFDGNLILIPNSTVIQSVVQNRTVNPLTRTSFIVGIAYSDSISKAQELIIDCLKEVKGIIHDPEVSVVVDTLGAASVNLKVMFWFNIVETNQVRARSRAMIHVKESLLSNGFTIPDEAREVVFTDTLKVQMIESKEEASTEAQERKHKIKEQAAVNLEERRQKPDTVEETQDKDLMRLAEASPLMHSQPKGDLIKP